MRCTLKSKWEFSSSDFDDDDDDDDEYDDDDASAAIRHGVRNDADVDAVFTDARRVGVRGDRRCVLSNAVGGWVRGDVRREWTNDDDDEYDDKWTDSWTTRGRGRWWWCESEWVCKRAYD